MKNVVMAVLLLVGTIGICQERREHGKQKGPKTEFTAEQRSELRLKKLEFANAISPLENPMSIRDLRKDLARLKTELKKKKDQQVESK